jgi:colicin import membrane protein
MMKRTTHDDQMRFGIVWSVIVHVILLGVIAIQWPSFLDLEQEEPPAIQVKIVSVKKEDTFKTPKKIKEPEPVFTQQSAAPAEPPKPQKAKQADAPKMAKVETKVLEKPKPEPKKQVQKEKQQKRPEKLDKSKDKKPVIKDPVAKPKPKKNDDFLKALSFIENLKDEDDKEDDTPAEQAGEDDAPLLLVDVEAQNRIKKHISNNWLKPSGTVGTFEVMLEIKINRDGTLRDARVIKSSGKPFFDNSLLRAVRKSEPIPYPADKYNKFKVMEIIWNG